MKYIKKSWVQIATTTSQATDISIRIIKENADIFAEFLCRFINSSINTSTFPSDLKLADITPIFKKGIKSLKDNYFQTCKHITKLIKDF